MLKQIDQYEIISEIMREHHEKYDGSGYPRGLKSDEIKPLSRIMIVADAFDAMTTNRVYKPRKSIKVALEELTSLSAVHFHPDVVSAAVVVLKDVKIDSDISQLPKTTVEEQRFSYFYKDRLTNLFIIEYLELILRYYISSKSLYMYDIKLHNFSKYNQEFGWKDGDKFLKNFAKYITDFEVEHISFRVEGDDFMVLSEVKLDGLESYILTYREFQKTLVKVSIVEDYIEDRESYTFT